MYGMNVVALTGNVANVDYGQTNVGDDACTFVMVVQKNKDVKTWVRVNVYGSGLVSTCRDRLRKGDPVAVEGELMNRRVAGEGESFLTEIRCRNVKFIY